MKGCLTPLSLSEAHIDRGFNVLFVTVIGPCLQPRVFTVALQLNSTLRHITLRPSTSISSSDGCAVLSGGSSSSSGGGSISNSISISNISSNSSSSSTTTNSINSSSSSTAVAVVILVVEIVLLAISIIIN